LALSQYPRYRSVAGAAEATALDDRSVDLITAAQAFHWFDIEPARRECLRILRPQGQIALIWNDRDLTDPIQRELEDLFAKFGGTRRSAVLAREDRSSVATFFGAGVIRKHVYPHEQRLDRTGLIGLALSRSYMPGRDTPEGRRVIEAVSQLHQRQAEDGWVAVRYQTVMSVGRPA
jgi:SAM-dependent methyltransferase